MNRSSAPRLAAMLALLLELALITLALVIVWTSRTREWYIDLGGSSATLDLALSSAGRLVATALLALVALVTLTGLLAVLRRPQPAAYRPPVWEMTPTTQIAPATDDAAGLHWAGPAAPPAAYQSLIAGDDVTQRIEQAVPQSTAPETAPREPETRIAQPDAPAHGPEWEDSNPGQRLKVPLRMPERRG